MIRKILVAQCVFDLTRAGAQQVVHRLVLQRDRSRFNSIVYAFHGGPLSADLLSAGERAHILPQRFPYFDPLLCIRLSQSFRREKVDIVHTHLFGADVHAGFAAKSVGLPAVTTIHADRLDNWRQRILAGFLFRRFDAIAVVSRHVAGKLLASWPAVSSKVHVIHNGVENTKRSLTSPQLLRPMLRISNHELLIGAAGRLAVEKGHIDLLRAFKIVHSQDESTRLVILGEGPLRPRLEDEVALAGMGQSVHLPGNLPRASQLISELDLFVLPSIREGLPLALLEAMMAGLPCIASRIGSVEETIVDGHSGRLVPPGRHEQLASAILDLLRNRQERLRLGDNAREVALRSYSAAKMITAYQSMYETVLKHRHAPSQQSTLQARDDDG